MAEMLEFVYYIGVPAALCLIIGLGLVIYEMFTPGFAVPGVLGLLLLVASVILSCHTLMQALGMTVMILLILTAAFIVMMIMVSHGALDHSILVNSRQASAEEGYLSNDDEHALIGKTGTTETVLRPAGLAVIDGRRMDVVTEGEFVEANRPVAVYSVQGRSIVVKEIKEENNA